MRPSLTSTPEIEQRSTTKTLILPPWRVLLHNDDYHTIDYVIASLLATVTSLTVEQAVAVTFEADACGLALVIVTPRERAEFYRERLQQCGLISTIEPGD